MIPAKKVTFSEAISVELFVKTSGLFCSDIMSASLYLVSALLLPPYWQLWSEFGADLEQRFQ